MTLTEMPRSYAGRAENEPPLHFGRAEMIADVIEHLTADVDVIVEGDARLGKSALRASVEYAASAAGWRIVDIADINTARISQNSLIVGDLDSLTPNDIARLVDAQRSHGARFMLTRTPPNPFSSTIDLMQVPILARATALTLRPLTLDQCNHLIDEQLARTLLIVDPASVERRWVWATSGGFPHLAITLLHDADVAPHEEGSLATPSRKTLMEASAIVAGLPPSLQRFACTLLPLVGVSMVRIRRFFDAIELSLLVESHVIADHRDLLSISPPVQATLRMMSESATTPLAHDVIADICASIVIDAECNESEVTVAARALTIDSELRARISVDAQVIVLKLATWLARRRGESQPAAALARRIITMHPAAHSEPLTRIARLETDDYAALANDVRANVDTPAAHLLLWALCLPLPMTITAPGSDELFSAIIARTDKAERAGVESYQASIRAAAALEVNNFDLALELSAPLLVNPAEHPLASLRAFSVVAIAHATQLNHVALRKTGDDLADLIGSVHAERGLRSDLIRRMSIDALTIVASAFGAAGQPIPLHIEHLTDHFISEGLINSDPPAVTAAVICHTIMSAQRDQHNEVIGDIRFLMRKNRTDTSAWVISTVTGQPYPENPAVTRVLANTVFVAQALTLELQKGMQAFRDAIAALADETSPITRLGAYYLAVAAGDAHGTVPEFTGIEDETIPGAMIDYCVGVASADTARLRRSAHTFASMGGSEQAQLALDALAPLISGDHGFERSLRSLQRTVTTRLRSMSEDAEPLTPREYEIALLASHGKRNTDIASQLFLSIRTVESHLYRAMRKLGVDRVGLVPSLLIATQRG